MRTRLGSPVGFSELNGVKSRTARREPSGTGGCGAMLDLSRAPLGQGGAMRRIVTRTAGSGTTRAPLMHRHAGQTERGVEGLVMHL